MLFIKDTAYNSVTRALNVFSVYLFIYKYISYNQVHCRRSLIQHSKPTKPAHHKAWRSMKTDTAESFFSITPGGIMRVSICWLCSIWYVHGLVQERCNSHALAMELHLSCANPSICCLLLPTISLSMSLSMSVVILLLQSAPVVTYTGCNNQRVTGPNTSQMPRKNLFGWHIIRASEGDNKQA